MSERWTPERHAWARSVAYQAHEHDVLDEIERLQIAVERLQIAVEALTEIARMSHSARENRAVTRAQDALDAMRRARRAAAGEAP